MKTAFLALFAALLVGPLFADDSLNVSVVARASLWGTKGFQMGLTDQLDADLLQFAYSGKNAGASFRLWSKLDNGDSTRVNFRSAQVWFKPLPSLKVSAGNVGARLYTEQLDWWRTPVANSKAGFLGWNPAAWNADALVDNAKLGWMAEFTPVPDLWVAGAFAPGADTPLLDAKGELDKSALRYGAALKYTLKGLGSVGGGWRDEGQDAQKLVRAGFDLTSVDGVYAFVQAIGRIEPPAKAGAAQKLGGISFDNYLKFTSGETRVDLRLPYTLRLTGDDGDNSYLCYDVKVQQNNVAGTKLSPFVRVRQDRDNSYPLDFTDLKLKPQINLGCDVGGFDGANVSAAVQVNLSDPNARVPGDLTWSVPVEVRVSW